MLEYNEIVVRKHIIHEGEPYEVIENHVARTQQRKPQNKTRIKNLLNGRMVDVTYHASDKAEEAEISKKDAKFLYASRGEWWFCSPTNPGDRFKIPETTIGEGSKFLKANSIVEALVFDEKIFGVKLPITVELKVTEAPPAIKGDTAKGGNKVAIVETGASVSVPIFVAEGDIIKINTETGEYRERVS